LDLQPKPAPDGAVTAILVVGLGSLARKMIADLCRHAPDQARIVVLSRSPSTAEWCRIQGMVHGRTVVAETGDALDAAFLMDVLRRHRPQLVIQAASLLGPFVLARHRLAGVARAAGFALQLPAQLPVALAVMAAVREIVPQARVINCSFPDAVNPVLARVGLAPLAGIGNAGILQFLVERQMRGNGDARPVHLLAHHVHAIDVLKNDARPGVPDPIAYVGGERAAWRDVAPRFGRALDGDEINTLTAASALPVLRALCGAAGAVLAAVPGFEGRAGGVPVRFGGDGAAAELPPVAPDEAAALFAACGRSDGIEAIGADGVVTFSDAYLRAVAPLSAELCKPLAPAQALERFRILQDVIAHQEAR
jgi:hypothetical protein